jgi:hypothetical protein
MWRGKEMIFKELLITHPTHYLNIKDSATVAAKLLSFKKSGTTLYEYEVLSIMGVKLPSIKNVTKYQHDAL